MKSKFLSILFCFSLVGCASKTTLIKDINELSPTASGSNGLSLHYWDTIWGKNVRNLTRHVRYPQNYLSQDPLASLDFIDTKGDKYGQRIQAILNVPEDGDYQLWVSADESAEVWMSMDALPKNKRLMAFVNKPSGYQVWDRYKSQKSPNLALKANSDYYLEVLHKEHLGTDYLSVAILYPNGELRILSGDLLSAYVSPETSSGEGNYQDAYHTGYQAGTLSAPYSMSFPVPDSDGDGLPDFYENIIGLDPLNPEDATQDLDGDMLTVIEEYALLTNPETSDSDADGLPDGVEVLLGLNALDSADALADLDGDGISNIDEYSAGFEIDNPDSYPILESVAAVSVTPSVDATVPDGSVSIDSSTETNTLEASTPLVQDVQVSWVAPTSRSDGSSLDSTDISAYKVYYGKDAANMEVLLVVDDVSQNSLTIQSLGEGTHRFGISTVTNDGAESDISNIVDLSI